MSDKSNPPIKRPPTTTTYPGGIKETRDGENKDAQTTSKPKS